MPKTYYRETAPDSSLQRVLLVWPDGKGPITVFCPKTGDEDPWSQTFEDFDEAVAVGADLAEARGQPILLETRDKLDWWRVNLEPINGSI